MAIGPKVGSDPWIMDGRDIDDILTHIDEEFMTFDAAREVLAGTF
jgi:hypothetical protein